MRTAVKRFNLIVFLALCISYSFTFASDDVGAPSPYSPPYVYMPPIQVFGNVGGGNSPPNQNPNPTPNPAPPKGTSGTNGKKGHSVPNKPKVATFAKASQRCVRPGDIVNFNGSHLSEVSNYKLIININNKEIELAPLQANNTQIIVRVPDDSTLLADQTYPVSLIHKGNLTHYPQTALSIHTCDIDNKKTALDHEVGEILVLTSPGLVATLKQEAGTLGLQLIESYELKALGETILTLKTTEPNLQAAIARLRLKFPSVTIDYNHHYQEAAKPRTYARQAIAWPSIKACNNISYKTLTIGIIDGQPDINHPALLNQNITVKNFLKENQQADMQHGTAVATILAGNQPASGLVGLLPNVNIMAAIALYQKKEHLLATTKSIVSAIDWLMLKKVRLVNISLSGSKANLILKKVFASAIKSNMIIFSAAGNNGKAASASYPAALPGVIAITAIDAANRIYLRANQGQYIDFSAPGVDIWTANKNKQGKYSSGTSYASPYALAIAAFYLKQNPSLSRSLLYAAMQESTQDLGNKGRDQTFGWGLIQASNKTCN